MSIELINDTIIWEKRALKPESEPESWSLSRILKIARDILLFIPKWIYQMSISLMLVPAQVMKTKIFQAIDPIGIIQETFIPPLRRLRDSCIDRNYDSFDLQSIKLRTNTGDYITGTFFRSKRAIEAGQITKENVPTVICFNPNSRPHTNWAYNSNDPLDYIKQADLLGQAINVVMIDYPGVGESDGFVTSKSVRETAKTVYQFVQEELKVSTNNNHIFGWSFGSHIGAWLAASVDQDSKGFLILDKGGCSLDRVPSEHLNRLKNYLTTVDYVGDVLAYITELVQSILSFIVTDGEWDRFNTLENIEKTERNIIAIYDENDEVFDPTTSYGPILESKNKPNVTVIKSTPNDPSDAYHHGMALNHCTGKDQTGKDVPDITKYIVGRILATAIAA